MDAIDGPLIGPVIGVVGGSGGVGASRFAAVLAAAAAAVSEACLLVDLDPMSGGLDVRLDLEAVPGARWSGLRLAGGVLDARVLLDGLPAWGRVRVLACDRFGLPTPDEIVQVLQTASAVAPVIVDLARYPDDTRAAALENCRLVLLLCRTDLVAVTAARTVLEDLGRASVAVLARGHQSAAARAAELIGVPLAARLPSGRGAARRVARGLIAGLPMVRGLSPAAGWVPEIERVSEIEPVA